MSSVTQSGEHTDKRRFVHVLYMHIYSGKEQFAKPEELAKEEEEEESVCRASRQALLESRTLSPSGVEMMRPGKGGSGRPAKMLTDSELERDSCESPLPGTASERVSSVSDVIDFNGKSTNDAHVSSRPGTGESAERLVRPQGDEQARSHSAPFSVA